MTSKSQNIQIGRNVIKIESEAVAALSDRIDDNFHRAVEIIATESPFFSLGILIFSNTIYFIIH